MSTQGDGPRLDDDWRKARASNPNDSCVEVHPTLGWVRDSKNKVGPVLRVDVAPLVTAIKDSDVRQH